MEVDYDLDGRADYTGGVPLISAPGSYDIPISGTGTYYAFTVKGQGLKVVRPFRDSSYVELRIDYSMAVEITLGADEQDIGSSTYSMASYSQPIIQDFFPSGDGNITLGVRTYLLHNVTPFEQEGADEGEEGAASLLPYLIISTAIFASVILYYFYRRGKRGKDRDPSG